MSDDFEKRFSEHCLKQYGFPDQWDDFNTEMPKAKYDDGWTPEEWADWWCEELNHCR